MLMLSSEPKSFLFFWYISIKNQLQFIPIFGSDWIIEDVINLSLEIKVSTWRRTTTDIVESVPAQYYMHTYYRKIEAYKILRKNEELLPRVTR
jgi:hypothetical protein